MTPLELRGLVQELIDENPFAIRALLKIVRVEFTTAVPTLAVTGEERPRLLVNLAFVTEHCKTAAHVKAVLCHEFLHVLLRQTSMTGPLTPARHLALDAVINAIIHRQLGSAYSDLMSRYYAKERGLGVLLRPMTEDEHKRYCNFRFDDGPKPPSWWHTWHGLYEGKVLADDIEQLASEIAAQRARRAVAGADFRRGSTSPRPPSVPRLDRLLGGHNDEQAEAEPSKAIRDALERATSEFNGSGIWRAGKGGEAYSTLVGAGQGPLEQWKRATLAVFIHLGQLKNSVASVVRPK